MTTFAIVGGTGLSEIDGLEILRRETIETPFGQPSSDILLGRVFGIEAAFLARHGEKHTIPPHKINYRANIWALKKMGIKSILAVAAVGGIGSKMAPGKIAFPDQIIDYTYGRSATFFEENLEQVTHIDFSHPYSEAIRSKLVSAAHSAGINAIREGTYGCTQGPRLESVAEILRMERDGCDLVGMTGMPEASLARELELEYACCAVVANWAAGKTEGTIFMEEILSNLEVGMERVVRLLRYLLPNVLNP